jgi:glutamate synthase (NADPH/NADH) small chain
LAEGAKKKEWAPRNKIPEQDPKERGKNFKEVNLGYNEEQAIAEAKRCIQCKNPKCVEGCPVEIDIPGFIQHIVDRDFDGAIKHIKRDNGLPAVCGRVCPQEDQCEGVCVLGIKREPVAIGNLERFVADYEREHNLVEKPPVPKPTGKKVAVVGSGPAGLTCAGDLAKMGHKVVIFEALHVSGGVLVYGIPEFRLPKAILKEEVEFVKSLGVEIRENFVVGKTITIKELLDGEFDAIFIANGAGLPMFMNIPGENLNGIYSSNEYLTRSNLMRAYDFPKYDTPIIKGKNVAVVGGGNTAMDSVRTALRLGAENAYIVYRRSRQEMPARNEEIHHAEEEGIQFHLLTNPVEYIGDENGWVKSVRCIKMELGEPDSSGRRRPVPIEGSEFEMKVDTVVVAIGTRANPLLAQTTAELPINRWGYIDADEDTGRTSMKGVWAGGDIVTGGATVILAMGAGKRAARDINEYLMG